MYFSLLQSYFSFFQEIRYCLDDQFQGMHKQSRYALLFVALLFYLFLFNIAILQ